MANGTLPISSGAAPSTTGNASTAQGWITAGSAAVGALGDYFGNKGASATSTTSRPAWLDAATQDIFGRAKGLADRPYTPYQGQRVAGLSGNEQMAISNAASLSGKYQPLIDRASTQFSSGALQPYMNPYTEGVLDVNARKINNQFDKQLSSLNSKRGMMDAFGSDRGTLLESQLNRGRAQTLSDANIQGLSDAYDKGSNAFFTDKNAALNTAYVGSALDNQAINAQANTGALARGVDQSQKDFDYGQFIESRDWNMNNFSALLSTLNAASGAAGKTTSESSKNATNLGGTLAGLAQTVAGAYINQQNNKTPAGGALGGGTMTTPENASGALTPGGGGTVTDTPGGTTTYFGGPNSAGGEAAGALTDFGGKAINNADDLDYVTPSVQKINPDGSTTYESIKNAASTAGNVLGTYQGIQQGGVAGYSQAAANAAALGSKAGVTGSEALGTVAGGVAGGLGLVNGIKNKDPATALNGAGQVSGAISGSSLTGGSALGTALGASGAATALPMAAVMFMVTDMLNAGADKRTAMNESYIRGLLGKGPKDNWNVGGRVPMFKLPSGEMIRPGKSMEAAAKAFFSGDQAAYEAAYAEMIKKKGQ